MLGQILMNLLIGEFACLQCVLTALKLCIIVQDSLRALIACPMHEPITLE